MPPRTRREAAKKQHEYRIADDEENCMVTPPGKKRYGGVLASLSHNVPATKACNGSIKDLVDKSECETIESSNESILNTPPPPRSVVVGKSEDLCSPLTQPRLLKHAKASTSADGAGDDDGSSIFSAELPAPARSDQNRGKQKYVIEDDESSDDDRTLGKDDDVEERKEFDPNATIYDSEEESEEESDGESQFEESADSEGEDEDEYEPEDDEYVPDEEEESASDEDLEDYVEEKDVDKRLRSRGRPTTKEIETKKDDCRPKTVSDPEGPEPEIEIDDTERDDATVVDETPVKENPKTQMMILNSPESEIEMAVIVDDDDDFDGDDILVATIIDDDDDDDNNNNSDTDNDKAKEETDDNAPGLATAHTAEIQDSDHPRDETCDESSSHLADRTCEEEDMDEISRDTVRQQDKLQNAANVETSSRLECSNIKSDDSNSELNGSSIEEENCPKTPNTKQPRQRKSRKSFFRMEGEVKRKKWRLGSKIGVGSFGVVHVGMNNETGKLMAVKKFQVDKAEMTDIRREVELMRSLAHENIVRYLGAQMDKAYLHIFQEWVTGGSVSTLLSRFGPFSLQVMQTYLSQTLAGLAYLHQNNIMHRDIKGSNILVSNDGIVKLADFGASKKLTNLKANLMMSMTVRGTPYFMAPEVFEEKYSAKADIWGIGCVAYQMITGYPPWKDMGFSNPVSLFNHINKQECGPVIDIEHSERLSQENENIFGLLCNLMKSCFHKDPLARPDIQNLQGHNFFTEFHDDDESIYSRGLFSPSNDQRQSLESSGPSPKEESQIMETPSPSPMRPPVPTPQSRSRSKSVVQWRTTFASPPRPKQKANKSLASPLRSSPYHSPPKDSSNWPEWARGELQKRNLFDQSPGKASTANGDDGNLSALMGSLALSEDSEIHSGNPYRSERQTRVSTVTTAEESRLDGLNFLDDSNATFEI